MATFSCSPKLHDTIIKKITTTESVPSKDYRGMCRWKHGVNTLQSLSLILSSAYDTCIECDVGLDAYTRVPMMQHAPIGYSEWDTHFRLREWLHMVDASTWFHRSSPKVVKFDFKHIDCVGPSVQMIAKSRLYASPHVSIWLNADVLSGPGTLWSNPLDAHNFLQAIQPLKRATWSLGWTTSFSYLFPPQYTQQMVNQMLALTRTLNHSVTFPIRASLLRASWSELKRLTGPDTPYAHSMSVWTGAEGVPASDIQWMKQTTNITMYDMEKGSREEWNSANRVLSAAMLVELGGNLLLVMCWMVLLLSNVQIKNDLL